MEITEEKLKEIIKIAIIELMQERKELFHDLFYDLFTETIEDIGMTNALEEVSKNNEEASEEEIASVFQGNFIKEN